MRAVLKGTVLDGEPPVHATVTRGRVRSLAERRAVKPSVDQANTLSYLEVMKLLLFVGTLAFALCSNAASAQLISERVENGQRICAYYGSDRNPQDELVARTRTVGFGENCPAVAYPRDLTAPPPPNAQLIEEANGGSGRVCVFSQGSQQYRLSIPFSSRCAMTPAQQGQASR